MLSSEMAMRNFLGTSSAKIFFRNDLSYRRLVSDDSEDVVADDFVDDLDDEEVFDEVEDDAVENVSEESVGVGDPQLGELYPQHMRVTYLFKCF